MRAGYAIIAWLLLPLTVEAFTTNCLRLQQGVIPTTNGVAVVGAAPYEGTVDTHIMLDFPTNSFGDEPVLRFHKHYFTSNTIHGFIRFENFQNYLPPNVQVVQARLYLTSAGDGDANPEGNEFGLVNRPGLNLSHGIPVAQQSPAELPWDRGSGRTLAHGPRAR